MNALARLAATVAVTALGSLAGFALGARPAEADPGTSTVYRWCPGEGLPFEGMQWNMNVCHDWFIVPFGQGNVPMVYPDGSPGRSYVSADVPPPVWEAPPPPPPPPPGTPFCTPRGAFVIIPPICDETGVDNPPGSVRP